MFQPIENSSYPDVLLSSLKELFHPRINPFGLIGLIGRNGSIDFSVHTD